MMLTMVAGCPEASLGRISQLSNSEEGLSTERTCRCGCQDLQRGAQGGHVGQPGVQRRF